MFDGEVITLSFEDDGIRALQARAGQVQRYASCGLRPGWVVDGLIHNLQEVGAAIEELLASDKFSHGRVVVGITGMRAISRTLLLPKMQASLLAGSVQREARREMPVPLEEVYLSWQVIRDLGAQQEVFIVGVPRELVDAAAQAIQVAGLRADAMDLKPMALARAVDQSRAVVASFEPDCLETAVVVDYIPAVMRAVSPSAEIKSAPEKLGRMADELISTIRFYDDVHKDSPLPPDTPLYLTGASAADPALRQVVEASLPYPLVSFEPPFKLPAGFPLALYAVNLGLAMKQL